MYRRIQQEIIKYHDLIYNVFLFQATCAEKLMCMVCKVIKILYLYGSLSRMSLNITQKYMIDLSSPQNSLSFIIIMSKSTKNLK